MGISNANRMSVTANFDNFSLREALELFSSPKEWKAKLRELEKATEDHRATQASCVKAQAVLVGQQERLDHDRDQTERHKANADRDVQAKQAALEAAQLAFSRDRGAHKLQVAEDVSALEAREAQVKSEAAQLSKQAHEFGVEQAAASKKTEAEQDAAEHLMQKAEVTMAQAREKLVEAETKVAKMKALLG